MSKAPYLIALFVCMVAGCDGGTPAPPAEDNSLRTLIGHVAEYHVNPKSFATCFAEGSVPDDATRKKFSGLMTRLDKASVDDAGTSATAQVMFEVLQTGEQLGPVTWTLVKSGEEWKVKSLQFP